MSKLRSVKKDGHGFCLSNALYELCGYVHEDVPEWILGDDLPLVCGLMGLTWFGSEKNVVVPNKPCIVIYKTGRDEGHAEYTENLKEYVGMVDICGIIMR